MLHRFAFTGDLHQYLPSLTERELEDFHFWEKTWKAEMAISVRSERALRAPSPGAVLGIEPPSTQLSAGLCASARSRRVLRDLQRLGGDFFWGGLEVLKNASIEVNRSCLFA